MKNERQRELNLLVRTNRKEIIEQTESVMRMRKRDSPVSMILGVPLPSDGGFATIVVTKSRGGFMWCEDDRCHRCGRYGNAKARKL